MTLKEKSAALREWIKVKRRQGLTDAQVQMAVVPLRQLPHDPRSRERAETLDRRRRKRRTERDHLEAIPISILTLSHMYGGIRTDDGPQRPPAGSQRLA